jgi:copper chaperone CopZ
MCTPCCGWVSAVCRFPAAAGLRQCFALPAAGTCPDLAAYAGPGGVLRDNDPVRAGGRRQVSSAMVTDEASSAPRQVGLAIGGMTCAACAARVEKKPNGIDSVVATVNVATGQALVTAPVSVPAERLIEAVEQAGYHAEVLIDGAAAAGGASRAGAAGAGPDADQVVYLRNRLLVAVVFFIPLGDLSANSVRLCRFGAPPTTRRDWPRPGRPRPGADGTDSPELARTGTAGT